MLQSRIIAEGNITRDPELRSVKVKGEDRVVCNVAIAVQDRVQVDGVWQDDADTLVFAEAGIWMEMGENVAATFKRGDRVVLMAENFVIKAWAKDGKSGVNYVLKGEAECLPSLRWARAKIEKVQRASSAAPAIPGADPALLAQFQAFLASQGNSTTPSTVETPATEDAPF